MIIDKTKTNDDNANDQDKDQRPAHYINERNNNTNNEEVSSAETNVENANAAGIGALGRNDEKLTDYNSNTSADGGDY